LRVGEEGGNGSDAHSQDGAQHVTPPAPGTAAARARICGPVTTSTLTDRGHCWRLHRSRHPPAQPDLGWDNSCINSNARLAGRDEYPPGARGRLSASGVP
jgi:hypothetical protein